jgi:hypothetical protein
VAANLGILDLLGCWPRLLIHRSVSGLKYRAYAGEKTENAAVSM